MATLTISDYHVIAAVITEMSALVADNPVLANRYLNLMYKASHGGKFSTGELYNICLALDHHLRSNVCDVAADSVLRKIAPLCDYTRY